MTRFAGLSQRAGQSLALTFGSETPNVHVLRAFHAQQDDTPDQFPTSGQWTQRDAYQIYPAETVRSHFSKESQQLFDPTNFKPLHPRC
jgi:hypothetical protein